MPSRSNRRHFLQTSAAAGIGFWVAGGLRAEDSKSPNERIAIASIGVGGKGKSDLADAGKNADVVAICDVDSGTLDGASKSFPNAKRYSDFRKMLEEMGKSIDAVTVSTPDHTHAPAALMAMRMGKHCFCQKPLSHTIYEARLMAKVAADKKVATQMGNQGTAATKLRYTAQVIKSGAIGVAKEVHVWTNRPIWPQGGERPATKEVPANLDWDLWLGPAPVRPYADGYHPFAWRGWWDFGTGALGDMACHTFNMPYMALNLRDPVAVQAETSGHNKDSYPKWSIITYDFPAIGNRPAVKVYWYDGGQRPTAEWMGELKELYKDQVAERESFLSSGCVVVGDKDILFAPGDYAENTSKLSGGKDLPKVDVVVSPGHFEEWIRAIKGGEPAMSNFATYSGGLTETMLLGNLAVWVAASGKGEKVEWDAKNLKSKNVAGLENIVKPIYRDGYTLDDKSGVAANYVPRRFRRRELFR